MDPMVLESGCFLMDQGLPKTVSLVMVGMAESVGICEAISYLLSLFRQ